MPVMGVVPARVLDSNRGEIRDNIGFLACRHRLSDMKASTSTAQQHLHSVSLASRSLSRLTKSRVCATNIAVTRRPWEERASMRRGDSRERGWGPAGPGEIRGGQADGRNLRRSRSRSDSRSRRGPGAWEVDGRPGPGGPRGRGMTQNMEPTLHDTWPSCGRDVDDSIIRLASIGMRLHIAGNYEYLPGARSAARLPSSAFASRMSSAPRPGAVPTVLLLCMVRNRT